MVFSGSGDSQSSLCNCGPCQLTEYEKRVSHVSVIQASDYIITYASILRPAMALDGQEILYFMSVGVSSTQSFEVRRSPPSLSSVHPPKGTPRPRLSQRIPVHWKTAPPMSPVPRHPHRPRSTRPRPALRGHCRPRPRRQPRRHEQQRARHPPRRPPRKPRIPPDQTRSRRGAFRVSLRPDALQSLFTRGWFPSSDDRRDRPPLATSRFFCWVVLANTSIGAQELRYHAYRSGNKMPPVSPAIAAMDGETPSSTSPVYPFYANDATTTAYMTSTAVPGTPDYMMSIVASHKFEKHSFEVRGARVSASRSRPTHVPL